MKTINSGLDFFFLTDLIDAVGMRTHTHFISIQMELLHEGPQPSQSYCDLWAHVVNFMGPTIG